MIKAAVVMIIVGITLCSGICFSAISNAPCDLFSEKIKMLNDDPDFTIGLLSQLNPFLNSRIKDARQRYNQAYLQLCCESGVDEGKAAEELDAAWARATKSCAMSPFLLCITCPSFSAICTWETYKLEALEAAHKLCN